MKKTSGFLTTQAQRDAARRWREKHPERAVASYLRTRSKVKERYEHDAEFRQKQQENNRKAYARNPKAYIASHQRWRSQPKNREADRLRSLLRQALFNRVTSSITELLGCSLEQFRMHIALQFTDGMTWGNHGTHWEMDHIRPCARFDLALIEDQKKCFHFSNLRPLLKWENKLKHARVHDSRPAQLDHPAQDHWQAGTVTTIEGVGGSSTPPTASATSLSQP